jgi:SAM-dependent methyltransferase
MSSDRTSFYDDVGIKYGETYKARNIHGHVLSRRLAVIAELLSKEKGGALLDIGCGAGNYIPVARAAGFTYLGLDASAPMIRDVRQMIGDATDAQVSVARLEELSVPKSCFDAVLALGVFELVAAVDLDTAFDGVANAVKPGGLVICSFANHYSPYRSWYRWRGAEKTHESLRFREFKLAEVRAKFEARGLTILETIPLGVHPFPPPIADRMPAMSARVAEAMSGRATTRLAIARIPNVFPARRAMSSVRP